MSCSGEETGEESSEERWELRRGARGELATSKEAGASKMPANDACSSDRAKLRCATLCSFCRLVCVVMLGESLPTARPLPAASPSTAPAGTLPKRTRVAPHLSGR